MAEDKKRVRIVMLDADKEALRENLRNNFVKMGAPVELADEAITNGSLPMYMFLSKWICHNTAYPEDHVIDNERFKKAMFAWIYYKATVKQFVDNV
jgi:hypothetical protein